MRVFVSVLITLAMIGGCNSPPNARHRVYGYVDSAGNIVIPPRYLDARPFQEGLAAVSTEPPDGIHAGDCQLSIEPTAVPPSTTPSRPVLLTRTDSGEPTFRIVDAFESASFDETRTIVTEDGRCGVLNEAGEWIVAPVHDHCARHEANGVCLIGTDI
jgi:hypothetical protein